MPEPPYRICFVCLGNICRSPTAAVVMRGLVADAGLTGRIEVESAGTGGWHVGQGANPDALRAMSRHGYDGRGHAARQFLAGDFPRYDLVLGLDRANVADLRRMAPDAEARAKVSLLRDFDPGTPPGAELDVPDPWGGRDAGFDDVLAQVSAACVGLLARIPVGAEG